jgi:hypothetical protein
MCRWFPGKEGENKLPLSFDSDATRPTSDFGADGERVLDACTQWPI